MARVERAGGGCRYGIVMVCMGLVAACSPAQRPVTGVSVSTSFATVAPTTTTSVAPISTEPCARGFQPGTRDRVTVTVKGVDRTAWVVVPTTYRALAPAPLLVDLHGHESDGSVALATHGFVRLAERDGAIVVAPDGAFLEDLQVTGWSYDPEVQRTDVAFIAAVLDKVETLVCVDRHHEWVAGHSNGGGFVGLLICALPNRFAAFGSYGGAFYDRCQSNMRAPVIEVQGENDDIVNYDQVRGWIDGWVARNKCGTPASEQVDNAGARRLTWSCPEDGAVGAVAVEHVIAPGYTHDWPDEPGHFRAAEVIWDFLTRFTLP
jgi:polyhydroxybutyrate depolymerase